MAEKPLLSIIIAAYTIDRLEDILELLESIRAQTYPNIETIVVVERSAELLERVKTYAAEKVIPNMSVVFNDGEPGLSSQRNLGIKEASGDIIAFIDDDALPFHDWAEEIVKTFEDDSIIGVTGPAYPIWEDESMSWFPKEFSWILGCSDWDDSAGTADVRNVWGMNMSFRKEAFDSDTTFSSALGLKRKKGLVAEEVELSLRVKRRTGKRIVCNHNTEVRHRVYKYRATTGFIAQRAYSMGYTRYLLKKLYREGDAGTALLSQEHRLLKRVFTTLFPSILKDFFRNPIIAWRKLRVAITALFFIAVGYYSHLLRG